MKRVIIGATVLVLGTFITMKIYVMGAGILTTIGSWRGNKLMYAIFGTDHNCLNMGFPFVVGIIMFLVGIIILIMECFNDDTNMKMT